MIASCTVVASDIAGVCDPIARAVLRGLAERLRNREGIERSVRTCNAERKSLAAESAGSRDRIEARLQAAVRACDRAYRRYVHGFISTPPGGGRS